MLKVREQRAWDGNDPLNHGILQDELVTSSDATLLRRVACHAPDTGENRVFLTTELTLAPGRIAQPGSQAFDRSRAPLPSSHLNGERSERGTAFASTHGTMTSCDILG